MKTEPTLPLSLMLKVEMGDWAKLGFLTPGVPEPMGACEPGLQSRGTRSILSTRD